MSPSFQLALKALLRSLVVLSCAFFVSCSAVSPDGPSQLPEPVAIGGPDSAKLRQVSLAADGREPEAGQPESRSHLDFAPAYVPSPEAVPFAGATELTVGLLVQEVLSRNPSLAQMVAAWQAASERYPQAIALEDPMFETTLGPASYTSTKVNPAYRFLLSQKVPFPGKRRLRGEAALAEASAAGNDVDDTRLQLVESAKDAFYEYYAIERALAVNDRGLKLLERFRQDAERRGETALASQHDVLQAEVEIGRQRERRLTLQRMRTVAIARINTLMNLPPDAPLPPPPAEVSLAEPLPDVQALRARAIAQRPDLRALEAQIAAEQARLALAAKEFCPDFAPFAMYDRFMGNNPETQDLAPMVGLSMNLPVYRDKRFAALAEARAKIAQRRAELAQRTNQVHFQVQEAYAQVRESEQTVELYRKTILTAAELNVKAAEAAYVPAKTPFLSLIEAQRNQVQLFERYYETVADYHRRRARLERVVGGALESPAGIAGQSQLCH